MTEVEFIGQKLKEGKIISQEHIAERIKYFPNELKRKKHIQLLRHYQLCL